MIYVAYISPVNNKSRTVATESELAPFSKHSDVLQQAIDSGKVTEEGTYIVAEPGLGGLNASIHTVRAEKRLSIV